MQGLQSLRNNLILKNSGKPLESLCGNPLQCSCLENPRDGGAWWAAVSGVAQSLTRLKLLSITRAKSKYVFRCVFLLKFGGGSAILMIECEVSAFPAGADQKKPSMRSEQIDFLVLRPGTEPAPLAVKVWSLNCWTTREVPYLSSPCYTKN